MMVQKLNVPHDGTQTGAHVCGLTTRYLADKLQRGVAVKWRGVERSGGQVVEEKHKQVFQRSPHCLMGGGTDY